jgi:glycosyltransferase involved in cell wall biosynthesis
MAKVLIYSPTHTNVWGGGQIYIEQLCRYMNEKRVETYILSSNPYSFSVPTLTMPIAHPKWRRFRSAFGLAKLYKGKGFDTIILNDLPSLWLAPVFKLYGYRVISLLHLYLRRRTGGSLGHSKTEYYLLKYSAFFCDRIFSVNKNNREVFGEKVEFIGNYVPGWFLSAPGKEAKKRYDFILIARFSLEKNIPLFLELLERLNRYTEKDYTALLVGKGPEQEYIERFIKEKGLEDVVALQGWVERKELPSVYDQGKCFVISSYHEGFATTLLEAHARGLPAIVTRSSGFCGEFVEGYGSTTGLVFTPEQLDDTVFYDRVIDLVEHYTDYEKACREKAKVFSEEKVLGPILEAVME